MKQIILTIILSLFILACYPQGESIELHKIESTAEFTIRNTCVDENNNIYMTGHYKDSVLFQTDTLISPNNNYHIFISKLDSAGNLMWTLTDTSSNLQQGWIIKPDPFGNLIVMGSSDGNYIFDSIPAANDYNHFIAKITGNGELLWATCFYGTYFPYPKDIATDNEGNILLTGFFSHSIYFGDIVLSSTNYSGAGHEIFIAKLDGAGNFLWATKAGTNQSGSYVDNDESNTICIDNDNNIYIAGNFNGTCYFPGTILETSGEDIFIAKYSSTGVNIWAKQAFRTADSNIPIQLNYNSNNTIDLLARLEGNGMFFSDSVNLGYDYKFILSNFDTHWSKNWNHFIDGNIHGVYYLIPHFELINSDPISSDKYYVTKINDTIGNYPSNGLSLFSIDQNGNLRYVRKLTENNSSGFSVQSLTINNAHESIIKCAIWDTTTIGNYTYIPGWKALYVIFKVTKPGSNIKGKVFSDTDGNGLMDTGEPGIPNVSIQIENKNVFLVSDTGGFYNFYCDTGYYKLSIITDSLCEQTHPINPYYYSFDILTDSTIIDNSNFGIYCPDTTGISDYEYIDIELYPNPSNGRFRVNLDNFDKIEIINCLGHVIYTTKQNEIDIRNAPSGLYLILIQRDKILYRETIIKR